MLYFYKIIDIFYYDHFEKLIATFLPINFIILMTKPIVKPRLEASSIKYPSTKQK